VGKLYAFWRSEGKKNDDIAFLDLSAGNSIEIFPFSGIEAPYGNFDTSVEGKKMTIFRFYPPCKIFGSRTEKKNDDITSESGKKMTMSPHIWKGKKMTMFRHIWNGWGKMTISRGKK